MAAAENSIIPTVQRDYSVLRLARIPIISLMMYVSGVSVLYLRLRLVPNLLPNLFRLLSGILSRKWIYRSAARSALR